MSWIIDQKEWPDTVLGTLYLLKYSCALIEIFLNIVYILCSDVLNSMLFKILL